MGILYCNFLLVDEKNNLLIIFIIIIIKMTFLQCTEEAHRPVDCGTVAKWILKNSAESENMNWYLKNFDILFNFLKLWPLETS